MSATITYSFDNSANYSFDAAKISISGGEAKLKLIDDPGNVFTEDFADDTGFTYDAAKAEFSGGQVQQKSQKPQNATFGASYTNNVNGNWGDGVLTGSAYNGANVSGGKLDLSGASNKYVDYDADLNADSQQTGCIRFKWTPKYSGAGSFQYLFTIVEGVGVANNRIRIYHQSTLLFYVVSDSTGATIVSVAESFSPIADTEYEIELNWDVTTGATRLFVDGNQLGTTQTGTGTRSADIGLLRLGKDLNGNGSADFLIDDLIYFDSVQHTSNYTPGYFVSDYEYAETNVILPEMEYTGVGTLIEATNFTTSFGESPKLTIQIGRSGNWLYWGGASWVVSNDTYAQATDPATFAANIASLPVNGEIYGQFKIYFTNTNSQGIFADLEITLTSQTYPIDNPTIEIVQGFNLEELITFTETAVNPGSDQIKYILKKGTSWYYWDGAAWSVSDGSYAQSNTATEITANIASFTTVSVSFNIRMFLHSDDGSTTPSIQQLVIVYDFSGDQEDEIFKCSVYWYARNPDGTVCTDTFKAIPSEFNVRYKNNIFICQEVQEFTANTSTGYVEIELIENVNMETLTGGAVTYIIKQNNKQIAEITVPVESGALLWDILA